jgi:hypothetical protein
MVFMRLATPNGARRSLALPAGLLLGLALAVAVTAASWWSGALGLGFVLAVLAGLAQRCSA